MVRAEGGSLRFLGPGLLSTSPAFSMSSASHSAGSSGRLAQKTGAGPTFQWAGKVDAICRSRSNRAKRPRAGCILRSAISLFASTSKAITNRKFKFLFCIKKCQCFDLYELCIHTILYMPYILLSICIYIYT